MNSSAGARAKCENQQAQTLQTCRNGTRTPSFPEFYPTVMSIKDAQTRLDSVLMLSRTSDLFVEWAVNASRTNGRNNPCALTLDPMVAVFLILDNHTTQERCDLGLL